MATGLSLVGSEAFRPPAEDSFRRRAGEECVLPTPEVATLSELFAGGARDGGATGFLLAQLDRSRPLLWVQERMAILEGGRIYPPGLDGAGSGAEFIHVEASNARAALWAMEEGLRCSALGAVIGEIWGDPRALDFTATRRLAVAAERHGVAAYLIRLGGQPNLSGARMRWRVASAPSLTNRLDARAPGEAAWEADLFRARGAAPGQWIARRDPARSSADRQRLVALPVDRTMDTDNRRVG